MGRRSTKDAINIATVSAVSKAWAAGVGKRRRATINDVAELAGVSNKTVSRVINDSPLVQENTRKAIHAVIESINYRPNLQARGLVSRRSYLVGLIYDNPNPQYVVNMQQGILDGLRGTGCELVVHPCDRKNASFVDDARCFIDRQNLYGVILTPSVSEDERIAEILREIDCRYIRIASVSLDREDRMIVTNDRVGGREAAIHLIELGHTRIAFLSGRRSFRSAFERRAGFEEALKEHGIALPPEYVLQGDYTFESGLVKGGELLDLSPMPTAVFAANDEMAAGVLQALRVAGQEAPASLSVVGFDDFEIATRIWPRLTTVQSPTREIGQMAAGRLVKKNDAAPTGQNQTVPRLVARQSTCYNRLKS